MGSGKSYWAKVLANQYNLMRIDLDKIIEQKVSMSISEFIAMKGEAEFRKLESEILTQYIESNTSFVMATGGGTPCFHTNLELMNKSGITLYLQTELDTLYIRLLYDRDKRPLIQQVKESELKSEIERLLTLRKKYYKQCTFSVEMNQNPETTFAEIFRTYA